MIRFLFLGELISVGLSIKAGIIGLGIAYYDNLPGPAFDAAVIVFLVAWGFFNFCLLMATFVKTADNDW